MGTGGAKPWPTLSDVRSRQLEQMRRYVVRALKRTHGNVRQTAMLMRCNRSYLYALMRRLGVQVERNGNRYGNRGRWDEFGL